MSFPPPEPGLVIAHAFVWGHEAEAGQTEGRKARPVVIVLAVRREEQAEPFVTVAPITHRPPDDERDGFELPARIKTRLGLDRERAWVMLRDLNQFVWPGHDIRLRPDKSNRRDYGPLPPRLFDALKRRMAARWLERSGRIVDRD